MRFTREIIASYIAVLILLFAVFLILEEEYFTGSAIIVCILLIGYREIWSLIRTRKFPAFDERVQKNISMSVRNAYLLLAPAMLIILMATRIYTAIGMIGYVVLSICLGYMVSYLYYDRMEEKLGPNGSRIGTMVFKLLAITVALFLLIMVLLWIYTSIVGAAPRH